MGCGAIHRSQLGLNLFICCMETIKAATKHHITYGMNNHRFTIILAKPNQGRLAGQQGLDPTNKARTLDLNPLGLTQGCSTKPTIRATDGASLQKTDSCAWNRFAV